MARNPRPLIGVYCYTRDVFMIIGLDLDGPGRAMRKLRSMSERLADIRVARSAPAGE